MHRVLDLSEAPSRVTVREGRLRLEGTGDEHGIPIHDLGVVVFGLAPATVTLPALAALAAANVPVIVTGNGAMPVGLLLPIGGHSLVGARIGTQVAAPLPRRKQAWSALVRAKLQAQAKVLDRIHGTGGLVRAMAGRVRSGDPENLEAQAARKYWQALFGADFRRDRELAGTNQMLNYGYGVLRGVVGRAVTASGLHPSIGLHHHHRGNAYPLVDDLIEPFRPLIDQAVYGLVDANGPPTLLTPPTKRALLKVILSKVLTEGEARTLFDITTDMAFGLGEYLAGEKKSWRPPPWDAPPPVVITPEPSPPAGNDDA